MVVHRLVTHQVSLEWLRIFTVGTHFVLALPVLHPSNHFVNVDVYIDVFVVGNTPHYVQVYVRQVECPTLLHHVV